MPDRDGSLKLWLLIADPSPPKTNKGPMCTPVGKGNEDDYLFLSKLQEGQNAIVSIVNGSWPCTRGYLYLMRASKFFERNTHSPAAKILWLDDLLNEKVGGYFIHKTTPTPLDPRLVLTKNVINNLCFPFQSEPFVLTSPIQYYTRAETAGSGFYPLGSNQTLHGGVHLPLPIPETQWVKSSAPGYIVAARLSKNGAAEPVREFLNNHNGFVLVRHELVENVKGDPGATNASGAKSPPPKPVPFYSLYMHMMPTSWPDEARDPYQDVPWLRRFFLARHGAVVNLDGRNGPIGQLLWSANEADIENNGCRVHVTQAGSRSSVQERKLRAGNHYQGYAKAPPGDMVQAYEALSSGSVVTFSGPFLPVEHGEILGFLSPQPRKYEPQAWLHWEFLAPTERENAIQKVWDLAQNQFKLTLPQVSEIGAQKQDNLLEADEIKSLLLEKLPMGDDRKLFEYLLPAIKERNYEGFRSAMNRFMGGLSQFAHQPAHQQLIKPEFETRDAQELKRLATQLYTVTVEIDNKQYRVSPSRKNPAPYHLGITYVGEETPNLQGPVIARASVELTEADLARDKIELHLQVPANAVAFELDCPQFHLDSGGAGGPVDTSLAQAFIEARWRGLVLKHASEWSPSGLDSLVRKLCEHDLMETPPGGADKAVEAVRPSSWYGVDLRKTDKPNAPVEIPILGTDGDELSLFDESKGMLPVKNGSGEVLNVHPVTFLWLLKLMQKGDLCSLVTEFKPDLSEKGKDGPLFWGWFPHEERPRRVGEPLSVVSLRRDWGSGPVTLVAERLDTGAPGTPRVLELATGNYADGVFSSRVAPWFWGRWTLKVKGHEGESPQPQGGIEPPVTLDVLQPRLAATFEPQKDARTGLYSAELHFTESCPESLGGYLTYAFTKVPHPADTEFPQAENWLLDAHTAGYVEGLKKGEKNVTAHYTLSDYLSASDGAHRVSMDLCKAVERFRKACKVVLRVSGLSEDGHTAMLEAQGRAQLAPLLQCAEQQSTAFDTSIAVREVEREVGRKKKKVIQLEFTATKRPSPLVWQEASCCNNVYATRVPPDDGAFKREGDFLTGLKSPKAKDAWVSPHYAWSQYRKAAGGGEFKLCRHLADQLEALRGNVRFKVFLQALSTDGLTVGVRCENWKKNKGTLQAQAALLRYRKDGREQGSFLPESLVFKRLPLPGETGPEGAEVLVLSVKPPPLDTSGWLRFEFDPRDIFAELLRQAAPAPNERVWLKTAFVAPNCYHVEHYEGPSRTPAPAPQGSAIAESLRAEVEGVFKTLAWPGLEAVRVSVVGQSLSIQVPFRGSRADWTNAKPAISVDGKEQQVKPSAAGLVCTLPLSSNKPDIPAAGNKQTLSIKAYITHGDALFDGERINIEPVSWEGNTVPRFIGPLMAEEQPGKVTLRARVYCCPTRAPAPKLRYTLVSEPPPAAGSKRKKQRAKQGFVPNAHLTYTEGNLEGLFEAEFATRPGEAYRFELVPGTADGTLLGASVEPLHLDYTAPAESH